MVIRLCLTYIHCAMTLLHRCIFQRRKLINFKAHSTNSQGRYENEYTLYELVTVNTCKQSHSLQPKGPRAVTGGLSYFLPYLTYTIPVTSHTTTLRQSTVQMIYHTTTLRQSTVQIPHNHTEIFLNTKDISNSHNTEQYNSYSMVYHLYTYI